MSNTEFDPDEAFEPSQTSDSNLPANQRHDMSVDRKNEHISQKVYLMPESYNQLRTELVTHWPKLWEAVQGPMAFNSVEFCYAMDSALDCITQFDSSNVDGICKKYLDELRQLRGVRRLHQVHEYYNNNQMEKTVRDARQVQEFGTLADIQAEQARKKGGLQ